MRWMGAIVSRNSAVEETGLGAGVLNHPATGIAWLANRLAQYGDAIAAGDVLLSGSFIRPVRSEEHTSELQSLQRISYAVFCLQKKQNNIAYGIKLENPIAQ